MSSEANAINYPGENMDLKFVVDNLYRIGDNGYDTTLENYLDEFDIETLCNWQLLEQSKTREYFYCRTSLGKKIVDKHINGWYRQENRPWYIYKPGGTLQDFFEREDDFRKRLERLLQKRSGEIPPAVPSAPVANVQMAPADITSIRPYPQIFAQGDEAAPNFDDNGAAGMVVASNTARTADGIVGINKRLDKLIELQQQTVNSTAIISAKMPGRITEIEDIPPYDPTDKRWVPAAEYSKIKEIATKDLDSMRSRGDKDPDSNSGIHGQHIWRAVGDGSKRRIYYLLP